MQKVALGKDRSVQAIEPGEGSLFELLTAHKLGSILPRLSALRIYNKESLRTKAQGQSLRRDHSRFVGLFFVSVLMWLRRRAAVRSLAGLTDTQLAQFDQLVCFGLPNVTLACSYGLAD